MTAAWSGALSASQFSDLLNATQGSLGGFIRGLVGDAEEARDLAQDVFVDAWRVARRAGPPFVAPVAMDDVRRWLFHAAYCAAASALRRRGVVAWESLDAQEPYPPDPADGAPAFDARIVDRDALTAALSALPATDTAALLLNIVYGFPSPEIAGILGVAPHAARKRLSRALRRLRAAYFAQEGLAGDAARFAGKERPAR